MARICLAHRCLVAQVELHTAHVGLVRDRLRVQLQHHRVTDLSRRAHGFVFALGDARLHRGDAIARQQLLGFVLGQDCAPRLPRPLDDRSRRATIDWSIVGAVQRGRLVQSAQVVRVLRHVGEHARGCIRIGEGRDVCLAQDQLTLLHVRASHPACQHRLAQRLSIRYQLLSGLGRVGHRLRCQDHQHAICVGVV